MGMGITEVPSHVQPQSDKPTPQSIFWLQVLLVFGLTLSTMATLATACIVYLRPALRSMHNAAQSADEAAKDMQSAAKEMEKTALMFQQEMPLTMQDVQRASEEWELVGKQVNFVFGSVVSFLEIVIFLFSFL